MFLNLIEKTYAAGTVGGPGTANRPVANSSIGDYNALLEKILEHIGNPLVTLMIGLAVVYFLWGVLVFVRNAENPEERKKGGTHMLFGALGIFIMVTAYGVLNLIIGTVRQ